MYSATNELQKDCPTESDPYNDKEVKTIVKDLEKDKLEEERKPTTRSG